MRVSIKHIQQAFWALCIVAFTLPSSANVVSHDVAINHGDAIKSNELNLESINQNNPLRVQLVAMGQDITLRLEPSRFNRLAQQHELTDQSLPTLLQGTVEGDPNSWARISLHDGQFSGSVFFSNKLLQLESRSQVKQYLNKGNHNDARNKSEYVFLEPESSTRSAPLLNEVYGVVDNIRYAPNSKANNTNTQQRIVTRSTDGLGVDVTRAIRVGIVVDSRFNEVHGNRGLARALSIVNSVDAIYQDQLGIALIVEGISVYDDPATDPMRDAGGTVDEILANFRQIRIDDERLPNDLTLVHLFSGHRDPARVIGLGWVNAACRLDGYDLSMSTPFPFDSLLTAHEMAHNLGALHDDDAQCNAEVTQRSNTLMWPQLSSSSTANFSNCSKSSIQALKNANCNLENIDVGIALRIYPTSESLRRSVIVEVANKDALGRSAELVSKTKFPSGTLFGDMSAGCTIFNNEVDCVHGLVTAGNTHSTSITATLQSRSTEQVSTEIELLNAADVQSNDNRATTQLLQFDDDTGEAIAAASAPNPVADDATTPNDLVTGIGKISLAGASVLVLMLVLTFRRFTSQ